jgi:predicted transcriptional regulator
MNFNIYLNDEIAEKLDYLAEKEQKSRNSLIRAAIEAYLNANRVTSEWPKIILDFQGVGDTIPSFESYRNELKSPKDEDLF